MLKNKQLKILIMCIISAGYINAMALTKEELAHFPPEVRKMYYDNLKKHPLPSKKLATSKTEAIRNLVNKNNSQMIYVKGGSFMMGPNQAHKRWISGYNQPRHNVTLSSYYISKYLVTYKDYDLYTKITNGKWLNPSGLRFHDFNRKPKDPVLGVTWYQANTYCHWLAKQSGLTYDLPTEAQWEYAARSRGKEINWSSDNGEIDAGRNTASAEQMSDQKGNENGELSPMPVGTYPPNPLGLYDMTGSVAQWAKNWFYKYPNKPEINPQGATNGKFKVIRGGSVKGSIWYQGVYFRDKLKPSEPFEGFRCAINSDTPPEKLGLQKK